MPVRVIGSGIILDALFKTKVAGISRPKAIRFTNGILSPGAYMNNHALPSHPSEWGMVLGILRQKAMQLRPDYDIVASVATGGIAHGSSVAWHLKLPHVTVRKQEKGHGLFGFVDGEREVLRGARVLLVEDATSTFRSCLRAMDALEREGAHVAHTLLISAWGFPELRANTAEHSVFALCIGTELIQKAVELGTVDEEHADILRHWLLYPENERWSQDGTWELPEAESKAA